MPQIEQVTIHADDGVRLGGRWVEPDTGRKAVVLIAPAMATRSRFYDDIAVWLAEQGYAALSFDYRGYGWSAHGTPLTEVTADAVRWAHDARDAAAYAADRADGVPLVWLGHSFGGQLVPFGDQERISAAITVSTGSGYWRCNTLRFRWCTPALWGFLSPLLIATTGYFPGKRIGVIGDLPPEVMRQWYRWCLHPRYILGESPAVAGLFTAVTMPMVSIFFTDDEILAERSYLDFADFYSSTRPVVQRVAPADMGLRRIGHHGFFSRKHKDSLWPALLLPHLNQMAAV
jgi:predicted alpha/beta hydrolase